ncbi:MAG: phosphatase PAP2 family protein [Chlamydiales bacterium]
MKKHLIWLLPIIFLIIFAPFTPYLDLMVSEYFYSPERGFYNNRFFQILFLYGELFGLALGAFAFLLFIGSFLHPHWKKWRQGAFTILATLVLGAGILTNVLLKGYWGRPRPKQIEQFGGHQAYRPFWKPDLGNHQDPQRSFPSGHVAMGFYFISIYLLGIRMKNRLLTLFGLILAIGLGSSLMVTRVVQGGHFLSDVVVSPILMWLAALGVDKFTWGKWGEKILFLTNQKTMASTNDPF